VFSRGCVGGGVEGIEKRSGGTGGCNRGSCGVTVSLDVYG